MNLNTLIPAMRRGLRRGGIARSRAANGLLLHGRLLASPLSREETRLAVIEVLG